MEPHSSRTVAAEQLLYVHSSSCFLLHKQTNTISTFILFLLPLACQGRHDPVAYHLASSLGFCLPLLCFAFLYIYSYFVRGVCFFSSLFYVFFLPSRVAKFPFFSAVNISGLHSGMSFLCLSSALGHWITYSVYSMTIEYLCDVL